MRDLSNNRQGTVPRGWACDGTATSGNGGCPGLYQRLHLMCNVYWKCGCIGRHAAATTSVLELVLGFYDPAPLYPNPNGC